jgi:hypothetical protein
MPSERKQQSLKHNSLLWFNFERAPNVAPQKQNLGRISTRSGKENGSSEFSKSILRFVTIHTLPEGPGFQSKMVQNTIFEEP